MPTPFNHLAAAEALLIHPDLGDRARRRLHAARPAFLLGNTAPDFGTLSGLSREASHFFHVPMVDRTPAHRNLFREHPSLQSSEDLAEDHAAFIAGYIAHLWLDQSWIAAFFEPIFGPDVRRGSFRQRLIDHNLLRAYLDLQDLGRLEPEVGLSLRQAEPAGWLEFAPDQGLRRWRDHLADQLAPGGRPQTIPVFAGRVGMHPDQFAARLGSEAEMERAVFRHVSSEQIASFRAMSLQRLAELVSLYMEGRLGEPGSTINQAFSRRSFGQPRLVGEPHESHRAS